MNRDEVLDTVISMFSAYTEAEEITAESEIMGDLEVSSMEVLSIICNIEAEFDIHVSEKAIRKITTVGDVAEIIVSSME